MKYLTKKSAQFKQWILSIVMFLFLTKIKDEQKLKYILKNILKEKYWIMGSLKNDIKKQCQVYRRDRKIYFKNYDGNVYELDLTIFSQNLIKN